MKENEQLIECSNIWNKSNQVADNEADVLDDIRAQMKY